ncbi:tetratricopeptide repeat protein, partial [Kitasatospora sp. DSM 101779]|uniref:tetratricopeptide repeat protein n=1 Tax=Kitasatospora sp. DSM 101779 TaxID=2853165 RepID=UPI0021DB7D1C
MTGQEPAELGGWGHRLEGSTFTGPTTVITGDHGIQHNHFHATPWRAVRWPHRVGTIPREADCFQHRSAVGVLDEAVTSGGTAVLCQVLAGTGGVGKTQLAAHYARRAWRTKSVDFLLWVTATGRDAVQTAYARAAADLVGADPGDPEYSAGALMAWLESTDRRWLVVLDDLADPADLRGLWPPHHPDGRVLVTTRRRDAALSGEGRRRVDVDLFTPSEAAAYLAAKLATHHRLEQPDQIAALASDLGHLPLALAQAAAYLLDLDLDCTSYRKRLADHARTLPDLVPDDSGLPDDQRTTVAAAWSLSVERANRLRPPGLARTMLELASLLDPNGIPVAVLTSEPVLAYLASHRTPSARPDHTSAPVVPQVSADDASDALRCLHRLSLADHTPNTPHHVVRIHNLIQRATREPLSERHRAVLVRVAADALAAAWPEVERDTDLAQILRANTDTLYAHAKDALWAPDAHVVLFRVAASLGEAGLVEAALAYCQHLHTTADNRLGPDHPDTLTARHNFAFWRGQAGDPAGAVAAFKELLADRLRVLGPDHTETLTTRHELARWQGRAGDAAGAATALEELLPDRLRVLGPDHPNTLSTRHELAFWRGRAGDPVGAATYTAALLPDRLRVLGPDHPNTLSTRHELAFWRGQAGDAAGAATALEELLPDRLRVLGHDHPHTLITRHELARWRGEAGDPADAAAAFEELLVDRLRVLGPNHPHTLATRHNLARWRGEAGDAAGAATALEELRTDQLRVLGPDHPHTLTTRHNLARWRGQAGDAAGAATALEELLPDRLRVLGRDHPHTLATRHELARWRGHAG